MKPKRMAQIEQTSEKWATCPIEGYEHYLVSDQGRVQNSRTGRILRPSVNGTGYHQYSLWSGGKQKMPYAHRLVWEAFQGEIPLPLEVDHIDSDRANNRLSNLQLLTRSENNRKRRLGWHFDDGKPRKQPKVIRQHSDETKEKLRGRATAWWEARRAALMEYARLGRSVELE